MTGLVFWGVVASLLLANATLVYSIVRPERRFWPPPDPPRSLGPLGVLFAGLGPAAIVGVLALGVLDWNGFVLHHWSRFAVGAVLMATGGGFALWGYFGLGVQASQGNLGPLIASGAYLYSRNPQYIGGVVGLLGWTLVVNSALTGTCWLLWTMWFLLAPLAEEPWLRERLGAPYEAYAARVPRFL